MFYVYLHSQGKGSQDCHPRFTGSLASRHEGLNSASPLASKFPSCWVIRRRGREGPLHRQHLRFLTNPLRNTLMFYYGVIGIKHYKMSLIFPSFGQNYLCNLIRMWNSEQPQWSSTFWQIDLYAKTTAFSLYNISFSKASHWVWVKGALCQKKQYHTPPFLHAAWTCYIDSE